jgi:DNA mismatch repair protein MutS
LHKLKRGKASKSYGIAVAQLAGLPAKAIARAKSVLSKLEQYELAVFSDARRGEPAALDAAVGRAGKSSLASQFSLFAISNENVVDELRDLEIEKMSEKEAKKFLETMQKRIV